MHESIVAQFARSLNLAVSAYLDLLSPRLASAWRRNASPSRYIEGSWALQFFNDPSGPEESSRPLIADIGFAGDSDIAYGVAVISGTGIDLDVRGVITQADGAEIAYFHSDLAIRNSGQFAIGFTCQLVPPHFAQREVFGAARARVIALDGRPSEMIGNIVMATRPYVAMFRSKRISDDWSTELLTDRVKRVAALQNLGMITPHE